MCREQRPLNEEGRKGSGKGFGLQEWRGADLEMAGEGGKQGQERNGKDKHKSEMSREGRVESGERWKGRRREMRSVRETGRGRRKRGSV